MLGKELLFCLFFTLLFYYYHLGERGEGGVTCCILTATEYRLDSRSDFSFALDPIIMFPLEIQFMFISFTKYSTQCLYVLYIYIYIHPHTLFYSRNKMYTHT